MYNQIITTTKEGLVRPHIKWPLVSVLALVLVSTTLFFLDECQKMKIFFPVAEEVIVHEKSATSQNSASTEQITATTYPTEDLTNRKNQNNLEVTADFTWPTADVMRAELKGQGVVGNQGETGDGNETFVWPSADEMHDRVMSGS